MKSIIVPPHHHHCHPTECVARMIEGSAGDGVEPEGNGGGAGGTGEEARGRVRQYFTQLREQLNRQEAQAMTALDAHIRERLCSIRQQQEDMTTLLSQVSLFWSYFIHIVSLEDSNLCVCMGVFLSSPNCCVCVCVFGYRWWWWWWTGSGRCSRTTGALWGRDASCVPDWLPSPHRNSSWHTSHPSHQTLPYPSHLPRYTVVYLYYYNVHILRNCC